MEDSHLRDKERKKKKVSSWNRRGGAAARPADLVIHQAAEQGAKGMGTRADLVPYPEGTSLRQKGRTPTCSICHSSSVRAHHAVSNFVWEPSYEIKGFSDSSNVTSFTSFLV